MANETGQYSEKNFWDKLKDGATYAGKEVVEKALLLYLAAQRPETPLWAKTIIFSALAYFILPTDLLPDFIPVTGYTDDLGTLAAALAAVAMSITPEVKQAARQQVEAWFGSENREASANQSQGSDPIRVISIE